MDRGLIFCSQDRHSRFVDEVLHVLIWLTKQIAFDDDRTVEGVLRTAFANINSADGLLAAGYVYRILAPALAIVAVALGFAPQSFFDFLQVGRQAAAAALQ